MWKNVTYVEVIELKPANSFQAVMASDFSIAQFRFLERLLVVHGHWCYKRIAQMVIDMFILKLDCYSQILNVFVPGPKCMQHFVSFILYFSSKLILYAFQICYFFYKNIAFGLTIFYFEAFAGFSGQSVYDDWYMILFNVVLTSLPVISLGVFEQDVPSEVCLQVCSLEMSYGFHIFIPCLDNSSPDMQAFCSFLHYISKDPKICSLTGKEYWDGWGMVCTHPSSSSSLSSSSSTTKHSV